MVDGRTTDRRRLDGYTISSPCEPNGSGELTSSPKFCLSHHIVSTIFHQILFILAGNEDMHISLDEFEIRPHPTTGFHGSR